MTVFHRFCTIIPLFLLILALGGCADMQSSSGWPQPSRQDSAQTQAGTYGNIPATALPGGQPYSQASVKVAILLPLSGPNASIGQSMLQAAQMALFEVGNDNFELISKDTGGTSGGATSAATSAINEGAQLILGPLFADEVRAVKPIAQSRSINMLSFSTDWTLAGGNTYIMGFLPFGQVERIAHYAAANGARRTAIAAPADQYGNTVSQQFKTEAARRGLILAPALSDAASYDSVFIPAAGQSLSSMLTRITNKNARKLGTGLWDDARIAANPNMNGAWFAAPSPRARAAFENRYKSTYGSSPVRIATLAYDATALAAALSKSGAGFTASALTNPNGFAGIDGIMRFRSNGMVERGMTVLEIRNGQIVELEAAPATF
jgi:branched-chain amino acid transport system substrate-binding protein